MKVSLVDGWLELDDVRVFKMKSELDLLDAVREVRRGARVGVLREFGEDAFEWKPTPTWANEHHPLKEIQAWLTRLEIDAAYVTDHRWVKRVAPDRSIAVVLEPDC